MTSLVLELQRSAMSSEEDITDLLRKAKVVARKLHLNDLDSWCNSELNGYSGTEIPKYREVTGHLRARNPYHGWVPVITEDTKLQEALCRRTIAQPIGEITELLSGRQEGTLQVPLPHEILMKVFGDSEEFQLGMVPTVLIGKQQLAGIVDAVRNRILDWSLDLESRGVLGGDLTFSEEEVARASETTYNIGQFTGVIGSVNQSSLQFGDYNSIHADLKRLGIPQEERNELEQILDEMPQANGERRKTLMRQGVEWVTRNADKLGTLSDAIRAWFQ